MRRNRLLLLLICLSILILALLCVLLAPVSVSSGLRLWTRWQARQQGVIVDLGKVDAPFLRPVAIRTLRITDANGSPFHIDLSADHLVLDLNLARILFGARGRAVRSLSVEKLQFHINRNLSAAQGQKSQLAWATLQKLLPDNINLSNFDLRIEDGTDVFLLRHAALSASEIEAGRFRAGEVTIASLLLHQTFSNLRGATKWQDNRLTLGGISLERGLDLESVTIDFSRLAKARADFQFDLDTFGGKIRASFSDEWRLGHGVWNFVGSASDISLAQTAEAIGFTDQVGGSLHACKLTFRGDPQDLARAAASVWIELGDPTWRDREAEVIMVGAALYNRQIQLQQLYVKQRDNQLTMSGQGSLPSKSSEWLSPDFRGTISGSINDLGAFASLFGAQPDEFAGAVAIDGTVNARERKIGGHVTASANALSIYQMQIDSFTTNLNFKGTDLEIEQLDLTRKEDWLHAEGKIDLGNGHNYSGSLSAAVKDLSDYLSFFGVTHGADPNPAPAYMQFAIDSGLWTGVAKVTIPDSRPFGLDVMSLPLGIGESWNEFLITPLRIAIGGPLLSLEKAPGWLGLGVLRGGILSGELQISGTPLDPKIEGDVQLIGGRVEDERLAVNEVSGLLRLSGNHGSIDFLRMSSKDADLSFRGEMNVTDADDMTITLVSDLPLFDATSYPLRCVGRIQVLPTDTMLAPMISEIQLRGGLIHGNWTLTPEPAVREPLQPISITERTISFCSDTFGNNQTLTLGVYSPPQRPVEVHQRKRPRPR